MKHPLLYLTMAATLLSLCVILIWRKTRDADGTTPQSPPSIVHLSPTAATSAMDSTTIVMTNRGPVVTEVRSPARSFLFTSPYTPPQRHATNEMLGPEELRSYTEGVILDWANKANKAFRFSSASLVLSNGVYQAKCYEGGIEAVFSLDRRYMVSMVHNELQVYADHWFREGVFRDPVRLDALSQEQNYLTKEAAGLLAESALRSLGLDDKIIAAIGKPVIVQQTWKERSDQLLPVFVVTYPAKQTADEHRSYLFRFDIMGIVPGGFVSEFHNATFGDEKFLQAPLPPGYREKAREFIHSPAGKKLR